MIEAGEDPLAEIEAERSAPTVAALCDRFVEEHLPHLRPGSQENYKALIRLHVKPHFGNHTKVADVRFADIDALHRKITKAGKPYTANRVVAMLSKMFSLAIRWEMRKDNPCRSVERNQEAKRKRYLKADELAQLLMALAAYPDQDTAAVIRLLLLTGARRGEVMGMRWADLDLGKGEWTKPGSTTKQKTDHTVPLSAPVRQLLSEIRERQTAGKKPLPTFVFPGAGTTGHVVNIKRTWRRLTKTAGIKGLRIHDLRHSFASQLASGRASLPLIGALLGHSSPATTARYSHSFQDRQRAAAEKVAAIITAAGNGAEPKPPTHCVRAGASHERRQAALRLSRADS